MKLETPKFIATLSSKLGRLKDQAYSEIADSLYPLRGIVTMLPLARDLVLPYLTEVLQMPVSQIPSRMLHRARWLMSLEHQWELAQGKPTDTKLIAIT